MKLYYYIVDNKGNFITRKGINADFSLTDNYNFAYSYDDENDANQILSYLKRHPDFKNNKFKVITNKQLHSNIVSDTPLKSSKMKLKKGSKQAKDYMAYIRSLKKTIKPKKVGAIKIVEKGETKFTKPSATYEYTRTKKGTFKGMKKIGDTRLSTHKDTKSHNVNIRVVSGVLSKDEIKFLETEHKKSKGYKYRAKILYGQPIVLKETDKGTPVQKWIVDDYEKATYLAKELNKKHKIGNIKTKIL